MGNSPSRNLGTQKFERETLLSSYSAPAQFAAAAVATPDANSTTLTFFSIRGDVVTEAEGHIDAVISAGTRSLDQGSDWSDNEVDYHHYDASQSVISSMQTPTKNVPANAIIQKNLTVVAVTSQDNKKRETSFNTILTASVFSRCARQDR
ncbi:hypothetical protein B0H13DRAFT_1888286 [Mycena leptocephala]|nr:hypothetical protein B0H13DRAFT_1888286 [Mycena leptocephala]